MTNLFTDRLVIVTGGTGALGSAVAKHVLDLGGRVTIPTFDESDASRSDLADHDRVTIVHAGDLADESSVTRFYNEYAQGLWASVHVAGGFAYAPVENADAELFEKQFRMNAMSCYNCCRAAIRHMRDAKSGGRIVNIAAKPALHPHEGANMAAYTASKAAVAGLTGALAE